MVWCYASRTHSAIRNKLAYSSSCTSADCLCSCRAYGAKRNIDVTYPSVAVLETLFVIYSMYKRTGKTNQRSRSITLVLHSIMLQEGTGILWLSKQPSLLPSDIIYLVAAGSDMCYNLRGLFTACTECMDEPHSFLSSLSPCVFGFTCLGFLTILVDPTSS